MAVPSYFRHPPSRLSFRMKKIACVPGVGKAGPLPPAILQHYLSQPVLAHSDRSTTKEIENSSESGLERIQGKGRQGQKGQINLLQQGVQPLQSHVRCPPS